ncbi:adenylosuccinate lyase [Bacteroidota bacterium]
MKLEELTAISPVDGRYNNKTKELSPYFSEYALIKYRVIVEVEYFIALCNIPLKQLGNINKDSFSTLRNIYNNFELSDAKRIKEIESVTNHDVKAVEYYLKEEFEKIGLQDYKEFIHFGLTSQDINNTATPYLLKDASVNVLFPLIEKLISTLSELSVEWKDVSMLARTHGQPASPTNLGKEIRVFIERLKEQYSQIKNLPYPAKFGGATGNFNAHYVAYPEIDWVSFSNKLVNETLGLKRSQTTTQIEHYDNIAAYFDNLKRINTIILDLDKDIWAYISMGYFKQKIKKDEVGSSAMPHKVNPIDFENSEGNLGISSSLCDFLASKLPISRLQRDLSDSTVMRNIGMPVSYTLIAIKSSLKGLNKLLLNEEVIKQDLENNWIVVSEAIQTILRRENYPNPFEALKELTRTNRKINEEVIRSFIDSLNIDNKLKEELRKITPYNYTGIY